MGILLMVNEIIYMEYVLFVIYKYMHMCIFSELRKIVKRGKINTY